MKVTNFKFKIIEEHRRNTAFVARFGGDKVERMVLSVVYYRSPEDRTIVDYFEFHAYGVTKLKWIMVFVMVSITNSHVPDLPRK